MNSTTQPLKERMIKTVLAHLDEDMRVISLTKMVDELYELTISFKDEDYAAIDPDKWGELVDARSQDYKQQFYTNTVFPRGHWEVDDAGFRVWVDDEK